MCTTNLKGDIAEAAIALDCIKKECKVSIPLSENCKYDLVVDYKGTLLRIQCKYAESNGETLKIRCDSVNGVRSQQYTEDEIDYIVGYDAITNKCYYIPSMLLKQGRHSFTIRLVPAKNKQYEKSNWAKDFETLDSYFLSGINTGTDNNPYKPCKCPYCNKEFPQWVSARAHTAHCIKNNREYFIDSIEGPIHYREFLNIEYKQKYPKLKANISNIKKSFERKGIEIE